MTAFHPAACAARLRLSWTMSRRHRVATLFRWSCISACIVLVVAWAVSCRWTVFCMTQFGDSVALKCGGIHCMYAPPALRSSMSTKFIMPVERNWTWHAARRVPPMEWMPYYASTNRTALSLPLWLFLAPLSIATGWAWARVLARRPKDGCPTCGYSLVGMAPASVCPECGTVSTVEHPRAES